MRSASDYQETNHCRICRKIIVIGCPGAGKSTFARKLHDVTGMPLYYLDMIFHNPDKTTIDKDEFDRKLQKIIARDQWIIDGNYTRTMPLRIEAAEQVFFFDLPLEECLDGAEKRVGIKREDLPWTEDRLDETFRQYILDFPQNRLPKIYDLLSQYENTKEIVTFKSRKEADDFLKRINNG